MQNSPARSSIDVGSVIDDTYTIEALIGRGGMGAVFLASHKRLAGKKVAIKMLLAELGGDEILARFKREADIASTLDHPNIVKVENYNVLPDGTPYIAYEFLQGESLAQRMAAGPLPLDQVYSIIRGVGSALAAAHRAGIVHRDLKPQNIFLVQSEVAGNAVEMAKVLDFGISKLRGSQTVKTQDSTLLGTPQYMAPEQATGQHANVDERTDIFALGAIVYEMVTGRPAFSGASIPEVVFKVVYEQPAPLGVDLPANVAAAIAKAMTKAADERYPNVATFVEALTGQPLALMPRTLPPAVASGERGKITANEAFAQTMGSGDHGPSPQAAPFGATVPSEPPKPSAPPAAVVTSAPTVSHKRSPLLLVALVLGGAAIAAGAMFFVMRGGSDEHRKREHHHEPTVEHAPVAVTTPQPQPQPQPTVADAGVAADAPVHVAKAPPPKPASSPPPPPSAPKDTDTGADPDTEAKLALAQQALHDKRFDKLESLTNLIITAEHASDRQRARAHMLRGVVQCQRNDLEKAVTDMRALTGFPALRRTLLKQCDDAGFPLPQN